ncbi:putative Late nodulin [Medicago truncatula]|uniref:Nodule Cysteine-Rich (NCR) secreted peptide n=1 Tax=Medicago truncatula TaxID=3880 RepID=A0A072U075_MEDTR|nr:Nodule Cysteine-Rich (NCR) secreted peptide [Medicago truncatula]RHN46233.1 putative Late nodulin [Medicago truncatula]
MAQILIFVYAFIILFSLFVFFTSGAIPCGTRDDCPKTTTYMCFNNICVLLR